MKLSLYQRLSISLCLVFVAIAMLFYVWSEQVSEQLRYQSQQRLHISLAANLARDNPLLQQGVYEQSALENLFHTLMVLGPAFEFYFLDAKGNILTYSADKSLIKRNKVDIQPILSLIQNQAPLPILGDDPRHNNRQKIFSAAPVFNGASLTGYLYVIVAGEQYDNVFNATQFNYKVEAYVLISVALLSFLFILMLGLFRYFTAPIRKLHGEMQQLIDNNFDSSALQLTSWQKNSHSEIQRLGCMYTQMVSKINAQFDSVAKNEQTRRELLAHISHDLRTPLASIQGFIETLSLSSDNISPAQRQEYMQTVLRNTKQLNQLIDEIFELAHLEEGQVSIMQEAFNLGELLYDVVAKFSLQANKLNVSLVIKPERCNYRVFCDIAKLERVLSNLIENALRHTPSGGMITLEIVDVSENFYQLSVIDNGSGIKKAELDYIFDARYRASNAINNDKKHNGLGLAITKQLLQLLNIDIKVESDIGKGAKFKFNLRKT
ncbi:sensor histidine kinase [Colwelliaceae bacterium BS250]